MTIIINYEFTTITITQWCDIWQNVNKGRRRDALHKYSRGDAEVWFRARAWLLIRTVKRILTNDILQPSNSKMFGKEHRYNEHV